MAGEKPWIMGGTNGSSSSITAPVSNETSNNVPHSNGHEVHVKMEVDNESAISANRKGKNR